MDTNDPNRPAHRFVASKDDIKRLNKKHGLKFVPCQGQADYKKQPATHATSKIPLMGDEWQHQLKDWRAAHYYVKERKAHLGGYPQDMLPIPHFVADIDKGGKDGVLQVVRRLLKPRGWYETFTAGRYHLWYPCMYADKFPDGGDIIINGMHLGEIKTGNTIISNIAKLRKDFDKNDPDPLDYSFVIEQLGINQHHNTSEQVYLNGKEVFKPKSKSLKQAIGDFPPMDGARRPMLFKLACWCGRWNNKEEWDRLLEKAYVALEGTTTRKDIKRQAVNGWNKGQKGAKEHGSEWKNPLDNIDRF